MNELPVGWTTAKLTDITERIVDGSHNPPKPAATGYPMLSARNIQSRRINFDEYRFIREEDFAIEHQRTLVAPGDVLLTIVGTIGRTAVVPSDLAPFALQRSVAVLKPSGAIGATYLAYALESPNLQKHFEENAKGTAQKGIYLKALSEVEVSLAPLNEQKRIADKLDAILARVDACRERLDRVPAILKRFRQSVLAAATSGKLTEEWRQERQRSNDWESVHLTDVGELGRGKSKHRPRNDPALYGGSYPFIQTGAIAQSGGRITQHNQTYSDFGFAQSKLWPAGTVCITIAANIADTAVLTYPVCFPDSVVGFVANPAKSVPEFVKWSIDVISDRLESFAPATAQKNINLAVLNAVEFQCPQVDEQSEIVRRVQSLFAYADRLEACYTAARAQVERLTPALLAKAFRGELVPQDPTDEPAFVLLERIRAARAEAGNKKQGRGQRAAAPERVPRKKATMAKSRNDEDVKYKPYLADLLRVTGGSAGVEDLFGRADLSVPDFYKQLAWEIENSHIRDDEAKLEAA